MTKMTIGVTHLFLINYVKLPWKVGLRTAQISQHIIEFAVGAPPVNRIFQRLKIALLLYFVLIYAGWDAKEGQTSV